MILGVSKNNLPPLGLVLPHFILSSVSLLIVAILIFISSDSFNSHYFQPQLLSITHIATIGFITTIIFGALYQILPVILGVNIYSNKIAYLTLVLLILGLSFISYAFWNFKTGLTIQIGSIVTLASFILFGINYYLSIKDNKQWPIEADFISISVVWLITTGLIGVLLVFNFSYAFIPKSHLDILKIHAHTGFIGWIFLMVAGVGSKIIPMFLVSHHLDKKYLNISYSLINSGLILIAASFYFELSLYVVSIISILIIIGILFFILYIKEAYSKRAKKQIDTGMKLTIIAFAFLLASLGIAMIIPFDLAFVKNMMMVRINYGVMIILGFFGTLIMGQSMKIIPFIIWMHKYQKIIGKKGTPLPKDLISDHISNTVMNLFIIGVIILCSSIIIQNKFLIEIGALFIMIASILNNINIFKAINHKPLPAS